jgi:hypothetical protein
VYFKYDVKYTKEKQYLYVLARPGADKVRCFSSVDAMYPTERHFLTETMVYTTLILEGSSVALNPFVLNEKNQIEYRQDLKGIFAKDNKECKDSVALMIDTYNWKFTKRPCFISAKNISSQPITLTISIKGTLSTLN